MLGRKFGRLTVIREAEKVKQKLAYFCTCDCGASEIRVVGADLRNGHTQSCGCLMVDRTRQSNTVHGLTRSKEWRSWMSMRRRCYDPSNDMYYAYGAIGISVCDRWNPDAGGTFQAFFDDMGRCPVGFSLERLNVEAGYSKQNCIWADSQQQAFNKRKSIKNTSGRTGVNWREDLGKWTAQIRDGGKLAHLGCFSVFEDAVKAREEAEMRVYGKIKPCESQPTLQPKPVKKLQLVEINAMETCPTCTFFDRTRSWCKWYHTAPRYCEDYTPLAKRQLAADIAESEEEEDE